MNAATGFLEAVRAGDSEKVDTLLSMEPGLIEQRSDTGITPVLMAMYFGHPELLPLLRRHGAELSVWEAAAVGDLESALQRLGEDPGQLSAYSPDGWTPLHLAVFFGHRPVAEVLLDRGADPTLVSRNPLGVTPLQSALARCNEECAALLVSCGADVNAGAPSSWPPIAYTGANGLPAAARLLLEHGADANARTPDGKTALTLALDKGHEEVAEVLRAHGGS
ncbi:MAG: putative ankyrin [Armatimonadetes bacterium]|jgi:ankyrin repeat protein|nr:putative ankyrin [Armatimonadota bacterium]